MNIVVSGATSGIGKQSVLGFCKIAGAKVFAIARDSEKLTELQHEVEKTKIDSVLIPVLLDLEGNDYSAIDQIIKEHSSFDILVNNAGFMIKKPFMKLDDLDWLQCINVNLLGPVKLIQKFAPYMGKNSRSHILNIGSMGGVQGSEKFAGLSAYTAAKAAISNLSEVLAVEFKDKNIAVNCLALGAVETPMLKKTFPNFVASTKAEDIASFIVYFALNGHNYFNGKVIPAALSTP